MADLIFTIKTPAELEGAQRAAQALEVSIGKAKSLGKEYEQLETRLKAVRASIEAFKSSPGGLDDEPKKLADATDEAAEKTKLFARHTGEVKKLITELSREFGVAGLALRAFANPIGATLTVAVGLFVAVKRHIAEVNAALDDMAARNKQPLSDFAEAFRQVTNEALASTGEFTAYIGTLADNVGKITTNADSAVAAIRRVEVAQTELRNAQEAKALAEINAREARGEKDGGISAATAIQQRQQVRDFFAKQASDAKTAAENAEIAAREKELADKQASAKGPLAVAAGADVDGAKSKIKSLEDQAAAARKIAEDSDKDLKAAEEARDKKSDIVDKLENPEGPMRIFPKDPQQIRNAKDARDKAQAEVDDVQTRIAQAKQLAKSSEAEAAVLKNQVKASEDARKQLESLNKEIEKLAEQIKQLKESAALNQSTRKEVNKLESETRAFESQKEEQKAKEKSEREEKQRRKDLGRDANEAIESPDPRRLRAPQASFNAGFDRVDAAISEFSNNINERLARMEQTIRDNASRAADYTNT